MTRRLSSITGFVAISLLLVAAPTYAQQADTSATDTTAADTTRPSPVVDTTRTLAAMDSLAAGILPNDRLAVDPLAADTALSADARRERARERARTAAEAWLSLIDEGAFNTSWDEAAASLRDSVSRAAWRKQGAQARPPLDSLTSRQLTRAEYRDSTTHIPGSSPVIALQYYTRFGDRSALEAVITTKPDTSWQVAGYRRVRAPADSAFVPADSTQAPADSLRSRPDSVRAPDRSQVPPGSGRPEDQSEPNGPHG
jgi:hypothetical protein